MTKLNELETVLAQELLKTVANKESSVTYEELSQRAENAGQRVGVRQLGKHLGQISTLCHELNLPLLSAKVINKNNPKPGEGFFDLYKRLNSDIKGDPDYIYKEELKKIRECTNWYKLAETLGVEVEGLQETAMETMPVFPDELPPEQKYEEGRSMQVLVNKYERNPKARQLCLEHYKTDSKCQICGLDISEMYGKRFKGKIHVHHITPLSAIDKEYEIDPIKDLIPVCPNCHMILHSKGNNEVFTVEEVRQFIKEKAEYSRLR